jgi:hypothetical protein
VIPGRCSSGSIASNGMLRCRSGEPRRLGRLPARLWHFNKVSAEDNALARKFFQQAVDLDPSFAGGYKGLCAVEINEADYEGRGLSETLRSAEALARRAVALDGADAEHSLPHSAGGATMKALWQRPRGL